MVKVAEMVVNECMSFSAAAQALGIKFENTADERAAEYSEAFRDVVDALNFKFYGRTGDNPLLTKGVILGWLVKAVQRLGQQDQWDRVAIPAKLVSDIMGFTRDSGDKPVLLNLTQRDIDEARERLKAQAAEKTEVIPNAPKLN